MAKRQLAPVCSLSAAEGDLTVTEFSPRYWLNFHCFKVLTLLPQLALLGVIVLLVTKLSLG